VVQSAKRQRRENSQIYSDLYAPSGFDIVNILVHVAGRPNPQINIGPVDSNIALLLCDATVPDHPIVYCSVAFEHLTKYESPEILGRNCRFLQSPDGKTKPNMRRDDVDNLKALKAAIMAGKEMQTNVLNYKKGGQPFMNLLTTIPIPWDSQEVRYIVGFQADGGAFSWH